VNVTLTPVTHAIAPDEQDQVPGPKSCHLWSKPASSRWRSPTRLAAHDSRTVGRQRVCDATQNVLNTATRYSAEDMAHAAPKTEPTYVLTRCRDLLTLGFWRIAGDWRRKSGRTAQNPHRTPSTNLV